MSSAASRFDLNQSKFIALTNPVRSIAYVERPAAPDSPPSALPIILLHGFLDNAASFVQLFQVHRFFSVLASIC
jgi:pimeloyl-ACP methyl ester carboxylesterase